MSTAAMNAVDVTKAGLASGVLSMSRMVGGTFGVAAVGALFQHTSDNRLESRLGDLPLSSQQQAWFTDNLGSGDVPSHLAQLDPATARKVERRAAGHLRALAVGVAEALHGRGGGGRRDRARDAARRPRPPPGAASVARSPQRPD